MHSVQVSSIDTGGDASPGTLPSRDAACSEVCQHCWRCRHLCWAIALAYGLANEIPVSLTTFRCCQNQKHHAHLRIHGVAAPVECDCRHSQRCRRPRIPNHRTGSEPVPPIIRLQIMPANGKADGWLSDPKHMPEGISASDLQILSRKFAILGNACSIPDVVGDL